MNLKFISQTIPLMFLVALLSSCAENLPQDIPESYVTPTEFTFDTPYEQAWKGTVRAISTESGVRTLDKDSGLIVTEYNTIDKQVLTIFQTTMFGRTYKNSYSVNIIEESPGKTNIRIRANLMMEQFAFYNRERSVDWFEAYMRQRLFKTICDYLYKNTPKCEMLFPDYHATTSPQYIETQDPVTEIIDTGQPADNISYPPLKEIQTILLEIGYNPGPIDGQMGEQTQTALKLYQTDNDIYASGELDQPTLTALGL